MENQATDRVYVIERSRDVRIFKPITKGILEEKIDAMIDTKAALMNSIVEPDEA